MAALFAGGSSVVHPLHCVFTLWGTHCTEQRKVTPTLFFWGQLFASIDSSHTAQSTVCVLGGLLTQARKWSLVINKWASTSYWQSLGGSSSPCIMHLSASELGQSLINSRARPSPLPKFKEHRAHKYLNSWSKSFGANQCTIFPSSRPPRVTSIVLQTTEHNTDF